MDLTTKLSIYGAIVATILGIKELIKFFKEINQNKRKILVKIQYVPYNECLNLIISNESKIPTKIIDLIIITYSKHNNKYHQDEGIPRNYLLSYHAEKNIDELLPAMLLEGESIELTLNENLMEYYFDKNKFFTVDVFDITGRKYQVSRAETFNPKYGGVFKTKNKFKRGFGVSFNEKAHNFKFVFCSIFEKLKVNRFNKKNKGKNLE